MAKLIYRKVELGVYNAPVEVLDLERDIVRLELVEHVLGQVEARHCSPERETGFDALRMMRSMARLCRMAAEIKMRGILNGKKLN